MFYLVTSNSSTLDFLLCWSWSSNTLATWLSQLIGKDPDAGKDWGQEKKGTTEDKMVGWHHWFNGHEFEQTQGDSKRQGSLVCCSSWGHKDLGVTDSVTEQQQKFLHPKKTIWCVSLQTSFHVLELFPTKIIPSHVFWFFFSFWLCCLSCIVSCSIFLASYRIFHCRARTC